MKISTKGRYALRLMLDLAQNRNRRLLALKDIAERQDISKKYLEQIVPILNRAGLLKTTRGFQGGYMLAKSPSSYTVGMFENNRGQPCACRLLRRRGKPMRQIRNMYDSRRLAGALQSH